MQRTQTFRWTLQRSPYYQDTTGGYSKYLDVPSMVDFFLINELTRNVDGYRLSSYMYKDRDSKNPKFFLGPVWDFNHGFGNSDYYEASKIEGWQLEYQATNASFMNSDEFQPPFWWKKVFDDPRFRDAAAARWLAMRKGVFATPRIHRFIDSLASHIHEAQQRNFVKWPILSTYVWPNAFIGGSYANEIAYLKTWILFRLDWIDTQLAGRSLSVPQPGTLPLQPELFQNYPNPFNPSTTIRFSIPVAARTRITVHDLLGRSVRTVTDDDWSAGDHELRFDASGLSSGLYYYRITSGPFTQSRPMLLMK
ncbi:MAG: CotH kinase family protein [Bacteroidetes bacterium]|nr:CotH kinase family protein [Bacteroidota bacterium]